MMHYDNEEEVRTDNGIMHYQLKSNSEANHSTQEKQQTLKETIVVTKNSSINTTSKDISHTDSRSDQKIDRNFIPFRSAGGASTGSFASPQRKLPRHFVPNTIYSGTSTSIYTFRNKMNRNSIHSEIKTGDNVTVVNDTSDSNSDSCTSLCKGRDFTPPQEQINHELLTLTHENDDTSSHANSNDNCTINLDCNHHYESQNDPNISTAIDYNHHDNNGHSTNQAKLFVEQIIKTTSTALSTDTDSKHNDKHTQPFHETHHTAPTERKVLDHQTNTEKFEANVELTDCDSQHDIDDSVEREDNNSQPITTVEKYSTTQLISEQPENSRDSISQSIILRNNHFDTIYSNEEMQSRDEQSQPFDSHHDIISVSNHKYDEYDTSIENIIIANTTGSESSKSSVQNYNITTTQQPIDTSTISYNDSHIENISKVINGESELSSSEVRSSITSQPSLNSEQSPSNQHLDCQSSVSSSRFITSSLLPSPISLHDETKNDEILSKKRRNLERMQKCLQDYYGCVTREDMLLLYQQLYILLRDAAIALVNLLYQYFEICCGADSSELYNHVPDHLQNYKKTAKLTTSSTSTSKINTTSRKGLNLSASAVGWLSSYLMPINDDEEQLLSFPIEIQNKISRLRVLLPKYVTHLRITSDKWPSSNKDGILSPKGKDLHSRIQHHNMKMTLKSQRKSIQNRDVLRGGLFLMYFRDLQICPRLDISLFPNISSFSLDSVSHNLMSDSLRNFANLQVLKVQRGCITNVRKFLFGRIDLYPTLLFPTDSMEGENNDTLHKNKSLESLSIQHSNSLNSYLIYPVLEYLSLSRCGIDESSGLRDKYINNEGGRTVSSISFSDVDYDGPLSELISLKSLDLSHNELTQPTTALAGLRSLPKLDVVDLSFNKLISMTNANLMLGNIKILILTGNRLQNVMGLEKMFSLERLDLGDNLICKLSDIAGVSKLPNLMDFRSIGNPIQKSDPNKFRVQLLHLFSESRLHSLDENATFRDVLSVLPVLDAVAATNNELIALKRLTFHSVKCIHRIVGESTNDDSESRSMSISTATSENTYFESKLDFVQYNTRKIQLDSTVQRRPVKISDTSQHDISVNVSFPYYNRRTGNKKESAKSIHTYCTIENVLSSIFPSCIKNRDVSLDPLVEDNLKNEEVTCDLIHYTESFAGPKILDPQGQTTSKRSITNINDDHFIRDSRGPSTINSDLDTEDHKLCKSPKTSNLNCKVLEQMTDVKKDTEIPTEVIPLYELPPESTNEENSTTLFEVDGGEGKKDPSQHTQNSPVNAASIGEKTQTVLSPILLQKEKPMKRIDFGAMEQNSIFDGPIAYENFYIANLFELYFRSFVFPSSSHNESIDLYDELSSFTKLPRIQIYQTDRDLMMWSLSKSTTNSMVNVADYLLLEEKLVRVSKEEVLPCGNASIARISPAEKNCRGFHGELLYQGLNPLKTIDSLKLILCVSNRAIYIIPDFQQNVDKRKGFPSGIPTNAQFKDALWPHALSRHPLKYLRKIVIGFCFQHLRLSFMLPGLRDEHFATPDNFCYNYLILTRDKKRTIELLQSIQSASKDVSLVDQNHLISIENNDRIFLDAIGAALEPKPFGGVVINYQIVQQMWLHGDREPVRRSVVLTDEQIILFDENFDDDSSFSYVDIDMKMKSSSLKIVDIAELNDILEICAASEDPRQITLVIRAPSRMRRSHRWRLICKDGINAEGLIDDVRKATSSCK